MKSNPNKALKVIIDAIINGELQLLDKNQTEYAVEQFLLRLESLKYKDPSKAREILDKAYAKINRI